MFRFTIRDLLWLMVVVGLGVGWWTDHRKSMRQIERLIELHPLAHEGLYYEPAKPATLFDP
ncbi:MAG TPA: hypothetical protein VGI40_05790 [Pirellulaceae bacterium]|jgi:hypothetical protein